MPLADVFFNITAKVVGYITDINYLTLRILDFIYLPKFVSTVILLTPSSTLLSKWSMHWEGRAILFILFKRPRFLDPTEENLPEEELTPPKPR